ncbi:MAG: hypothetical protein K9G59_14090 [Caulobacter sp.]|nr:hypothetical protein [Caulobacter sp.]
MNAFGRALCVGAVTGMVLLAGQATACSLVPYKESNYRIDTRRMPAMMLASAATVDLVVAESVDRSTPAKPLEAEEDAQLAAATSDAERAEIRADFADYRDQWRRSGAGKVTYRVVDRLKGASPDRFTLNAFMPLEINLDVAADLKRFVAERGAFLRPKDTWVRSVRDLDEWGGLGSCSSPVFAVEGMHYLIFRDANGRLLRDGVAEMVRVGGRFEPSTRDGPVYEAVLPEGDPWLEAVRTAAGRPGAP